LLTFRKRRTRVRQLPRRLSQKWLSPRPNSCLAVIDPTKKEEGGGPQSVFSGRRVT